MYRAENRSLDPRSDSGLKKSLWMDLRNGKSAKRLKNNNTNALFVRMSDAEVRKNTPISLCMRLNRILGSELEMIYDFLHNICNLKH